jgi:hypothetical protein
MRKKTGAANARFLANSIVKKGQRQTVSDVRPDINPESIYAEPSAQFIVAWRWMPFCQ